MDEYERLAEEITKRLVVNTGVIELTPKEALSIVNYLYAMSKIQKILDDIKDQRLQSEM